MEFRSSSDGIINGGLSRAWQVTLDGTNGSLKFVNFEPGDTFVLVIKQSTDGRNYPVTWPSNFADPPSNLSTVSGASDVFMITYDGTNFRFGAGAPSRLPAKLMAASLGAMVLMTGANAGLTYKMTAGSGSGEAEIGRLPAADRQMSGTGSGVGSGKTLSVRDGSGSYKTGRWGGIAVGMNDPFGGRIDSRSNSGSWLPNGNLRTRGTLSGAATLTLSPLGGATLTTGAVPCIKAGGTIGWMERTATGTLKATCN